jgi:hypothetical protein
MSTTNVRILANALQVAHSPILADTVRIAWDTAALRCMKSLSGGPLAVSNEVEETRDGRGLVFSCTFHYMNDVGFHDGYGAYTVTLRPGWYGTEVSVKGHRGNKQRYRDCVDYIAETFHDWADQSVTLEIVP